MRKRSKQNNYMEDNGYETRAAFSNGQNKGASEEDSLYQTYIPQNPYDPNIIDPKIYDPSRVIPGRQSALIYRRKKRLLIATIAAVAVIIICLVFIFLHFAINIGKQKKTEGEVIYGKGIGDAPGGVIEAVNGGKQVILPSDLAVADHVTLGRYEQDNNYDNGPEDIEWEVRARAGDSILLVSEYGLDSMPYNDHSRNVTWENCSLRKWLNDSFFYTAFDSQEQAVIVDAYLDNKDNEKGTVSGGAPTTDKVFLLSLEDIRNYYDLDPYDTEQLPHKRTEAKATAYAISRGAYVVTAEQVAAHKEFYKERQIGENGWWWLRSPGTGATNAASVYSYGAVHYNGEDVAQTGGLVRPAIWVSLR